MAKTEKTKTLERTYNIPLRKEYQKSPRWKRTKKAVIATKQFLQKHFKSEEVKLGKHLNENLWKRGIQNPPHHIKVTAIKDEKGVVRAELFGHKIEGEKKEEKKTSKLEEVAKKAGIKIPKKEVKKTEEKSKKEVSEESKLETPASKQESKVSAGNTRDDKFPKEEKQPGKESEPQKEDRPEPTQKPKEPTEETPKQA